jgi:predicted adenine nucleotide alpha hydrolase (AANH) superfamily ATPase
MVEEMMASSKLDKIAVFFYNPHNHSQCEYEI